MSSFLPDPQTILALKDKVSFLLPSSQPAYRVSATAVISTAIVGLLAWEQITYFRKKKDLPGPAFKIPLIGALMDSINPTFEGYLSKWNSGALSCVSVFDRFIVIASTCDLSRKILSTPAYTEPSIVDAMRYVLCSDNWVFLGGKEHVEYRRGLNVLFTRKALGMYVPIGDKVYEKHIKQWLTSNGESKQYQLIFRELNMEASLRVFVGNFISDEIAHVISQKYFDITASLELVNFPLPLPGTKVYKAMKARQFIVDRFIESVQDARKRLENGGDITCMMDAWLRSMLDNDDGTGKPQRMFTDREIALTLLSFLFASQDATSSGVTWAFQLLADHPDVLRRLREEQVIAREGNLKAPLTLESLERMTYTRQVIKEVLRLRPPVLMVPYQTKSEWQITEGYTVPKGTMVIPTTYPALHDPEAYPNPEDFNPDRWGPQGTAENFPKNYMVFGNGPHYCLGKEYAFLHMMGAVAQAAVETDWVHTRTEKSDHITIFATTYPTDGCIMSFVPRQTPIVVDGKTY